MIKPNRSHVNFVVLTNINKDMGKSNKYILPNLGLLNDYAKSYSPTSDETNATIEKIRDIFTSFDITLEGGNASIGSNVTQYEFSPKIGTKLAKIRGLEGDIALHLGVVGVRIIAPVRGKAVIAIEVPNAKANIVGLKTVLIAPSNMGVMDLPIALGETSVGEPFVFDLAKAPHVLIGGATSMGKSVGINVILTSLIMNIKPNMLKFILIDVKRVELNGYNKISSQYKTDFLDEMVYTETTKIVKTLEAVVSEMDTRFDLLKNGGCRTIKEYNRKYAKGELSFNDGHQHLPYIVIVIDEFADLMMTVGKNVEYSITRLAQLARAVGIHLIVATQRPTTTVITGNIKANFPVRIAYRVASNIDSRTILDIGGAENLIGMGDSLISTGVNLDRIQTAWIDSDEINRVIEFISKQRS